MTRGNMLLSLFFLSFLCIPCLLSAAQEDFGKTFNTPNGHLLYMLYNGWNKDPFAGVTIQADAKIVALSAISGGADSDVMDLSPDDPKPVYYVEVSGSCGGRSACDSSINSAMALAEPGTIIKVGQGTYPEGITLNQSKELTVESGLDSEFIAVTGESTIRTMTVTNGSVVLKKGCLAVQDYREAMAALPYPFSAVAEYDEKTATFFGRIKIGDLSYLASVESRTGKMTTLTELPSFDGWYSGASALDIDKKRFFFIASLKRENYLCVVDIAARQVAKSLLLSDPVKNIEFEPSNKSLLGLSNIGIDRFVSIDLHTGNVKELSKLGIIEGTGSGALLDGDNFFFIGSWGGKTHICIVYAKTGIMTELSGKYIGLNEYMVESFKENGDVDALFTHGVQSCTAIAGYDPDSGVGFIGHFTPRYRNIEKALFDIDKTIREMRNNRGLKDMKLFVVGGVRDNEDSVQNLMTVYGQLVEQYGVRYSEIKKFNTGISYTIIIHNGEVKIF